MNQQQTVTTVGVVVAALIVVGGGVAYAAKDAQPGDMLYSLHASLYGGEDDDDVDANFTGAKNAYDEASDLQDRNALTASEQARLSARYSLHVNAVMRRIAELEADGDMAASAELRADLRAILRDYNDIFPNVNGGMDSSSSMNTSSSTTTSSDDDDDDSSTSSTTSNTGASSSIFVQPSSSVTSA